MNIKNENEYISQLNRIWHKNRGLSRFEYFTDIMFEWYMDFYKRIKDFPVVVLGTGIPLELVLSLGAHPLYLPGGSHETCAFSEHLVPRDTDPVSRSILGYLNSPDAPDLSESLFLVPLTSDSMRKAAYLLKEDGKKVLPVDIPPVRGDSNSLVKWERQMELLTTELEDHLGHGLRERELRRNTLLVSKARGFLYEFLKAASENEDLIPGSARMLVQNSFYCARDLTEWTASVKQLTMEILSHSAKRPSGHDARPRVLLMGSPVFFPGYKIPFLLEETGLCIFRNLEQRIRSGAFSSSILARSLPSRASAWDPPFFAGPSWTRHPFPRAGGPCPSPPISSWSEWGFSSRSGGFWKKRAHAPAGPIAAAAPTAVPPKAVSAITASLKRSEARQVFQRRITDPASAASPSLAPEPATASPPAPL